MNFRRNGGGRGDLVDMPFEAQRGQRFQLQKALSYDVKNVGGKALLYTWEAGSRKHGFDARGQKQIIPAGSCFTFIERLIVGEFSNHVGVLFDDSRMALLHDNHCTKGRTTLIGGARASNERRQEVPKNDPDVIDAEFVRTAEHKPAEPSAAEKLKRARQALIDLGIDPDTILG